MIASGPSIHDPDGAYDPAPGGLHPKAVQWRRNGPVRVVGE